MDSMFDPKIPCDTLDPRKFLITYAAAEAAAYNNECPVEQIGSQFGKQVFGNSSADSAADRGLIAVNRDTFSGVPELMKKLSEITQVGLPEWKISKVNLK